MHTTMGFTGTRQGMRLHQSARIREYMELYKAQGFTDFVHGDCEGADTMAAYWASDLGYKVHTRPSTLESTRGGFGVSGASQELYEPVEPLERNRAIVDQADIMLAAPATANEVTRSGTWATVRYARKQGKTVHLIGPGI